MVSSRPKRLSATKMASSTYLDPSSSAAEDEDLGHDESDDDNKSRRPKRASSRRAGSSPPKSTNTARRIAASSKKSVNVSPSRSEAPKTGSPGLQANDDDDATTMREATASSSSLPKRSLLASPTDSEPDRKKKRAAPVLAAAVVRPRSATTTTTSTAASSSSRILASNRRNTLSRVSTSSPSFLSELSGADERAQRVFTSSPKRPRNASSSFALPATGNKRFALASTTGSPSARTRTLVRSSSLTFPFQRSSQDSSPGKTAVWVARKLTRIVWARLDLSGDKVADEEETDGFWWPAWRVTSDGDLIKKDASCSVQLFQAEPGTLTDLKYRGTKHTITSLSPAKILTFFVPSTGVPRFTSKTYALPRQLSSATADSVPSPASPPPSFAADFEAVVRIARQEMQRIEREELDDSSDSDGGLDDSDAMVSTWKGKGKGKRLQEKNHSDEEESDVLFGIRARREVARKWLDSDVDDDELPSYKPGDHVFLRWRKQWWGGIVRGAPCARLDSKKKKSGVDRVVSCEMVGESRSKDFQERDIVPRAQLWTKDCEPWGVFTTERINDFGLTASQRPKTPSPSSDDPDHQAFDDLDLPSQILRTRPTLARIIRGEYPPAVKAHREFTTTSAGKRVDISQMAAVVVDEEDVGELGGQQMLGKGAYGAFSEETVETYLLPELGRWLFGRASVSGWSGEEVEQQALPKGDKAFEAMSQTLKRQYIQDILLPHLLIEIIVLSNGLRLLPLSDAPSPSSDQETRPASSIPHYPFDPSFEFPSPEDYGLSMTAEDLVRELMIYKHAAHLFSIERTSPFAWVQSEHEERMRRLLSAVVRLKREVKIMEEERRYEDSDQRRRRERKTSELEKTEDAVSDARRAERTARVGEEGHGEGDEEDEDAGIGCGGVRERKEKLRVEELSFDERGSKTLDGVKLRLK